MVTQAKVVERVWAVVSDATSAGRTLMVGVVPHACTAPRSRVMHPQGALKQFSMRGEAREGKLVEAGWACGRATAHHMDGGAGAMPRHGPCIMIHECAQLPHQAPAHLPGTRGRGSSTNGMLPYMIQKTKLTVCVEDCICCYAQKCTGS